MDEDEFIEVESYPLEVLIQQVYSGAIQDGKTVAGLLLASKRLGR